jgi:hypothetical protein
VTALDDHYAVAANISEGWLDAVRMLDSTPSYKAIHVVIRVLGPVAEDASIRAAAQALIDEHNAAHEDRPNQQKPHIDTTRNTIFPARWAQRTDGPAALVAYYRERYTRDGLRGFGDNRRGTYFGRIVAYPRGDGQESADQLGDTIRKLTDECAKRNPKSSRYEINVYNERKDRSPTSFPCLAHPHERADGSGRVRWKLSRSLILRTHTPRASSPSRSSGAFSAQLASWGAR